jgi:hypothetical protein
MKVQKSAGGGRARGKFLGEKEKREKGEKDKEIT